MKELTSKTCLCCGKDFKAEYKQTKYCSARCLDRTRQKTYSRTRNGAIRNAYKRFKSRTDDQIVSVEELIRWSERGISFDDAFDNWKKNEYYRELVPSLDKMDPSKPGVIGNIMWSTPFEKSIRRIHKRPVQGIDPETGIVMKEYQTMRDVENAGFDIIEVYTSCMKKETTHKKYIWRFKDTVNWWDNE